MALPLTIPYLSVSPFIFLFSLRPTLFVSSVSFSFDSLFFVSFSSSLSESMKVYLSTQVPVFNAIPSLSVSVSLPLTFCILRNCLSVCLFVSFANKVSDHFPPQISNKRERKRVKRTLQLYCLGKAGD